MSRHEVVLPIKYTSREISNISFVQVKTIKNTIRKEYDIFDQIPDEFGLTPRGYYENEKYFYQLLNNMTYTSQDGKSIRLTPRCLEIGYNYIIIEKYECAMVDHIKKGKMFEYYGNLLVFTNKFIVPITKKLDDMKIVHGDFHPRNIVFDTDLSRCSIIDFGLSYLCKKPKCSKNVQNLRDFTSDPSVKLFYPELRNQECLVQ